jgi:flagellar hook protein FlgE
MDTNFAIANSGLRVTQVRQDVTANNIANVNTDRFQAKSVVQTEQNPGVAVGAIRKTPNTNPMGFSNTDLATEMTNMMVNRDTYGADARVIKVQDRMLGEVINLIH